MLTHFKKKYVCLRILWDRKMSATKVVTKINDQTEIFQYLTPSVPPLTERDHCLLR